MRRMTYQLVCAAALALTVACAPPPVDEGSTEQEVQPPVKSIAARAAEAEVAQRHCSNDVAPADVQAKSVPAARDPLLRFPAEQKVALKQALLPGQWSPTSVSAQKRLEKTKVLPELDRGL